MTQVQTCGICDGKGYFRCPICHGKGVARREAHTPSQIFKEEQEAETCHSCQGVGRLLCNVCGGSGKILIDKPGATGFRSLP